MTDFPSSSRDDDGWPGQLSGSPPPLPAPPPLPGTSPPPPGYQPPGYPPPPGYQPGGYQPPGYQPGGYQPPGYQPPGYPPPGYAPYGYGGMVVKQDHPQGTLVLILGLVSIAFCQLTGPFAWSMGTKALREIDSQPDRYGNRSSVVAGRIMGIVGSVLLFLVIGFFVLVMIVGILGSSTSENIDGELRRMDRAVSVLQTD